MTAKKLAASVRRVHLGPVAECSFSDRGFVPAKLTQPVDRLAAIKAPPAGVGGFTPLWPLYKVEHTIAQLGRWRRLSRCYEGTEASARAWLEVASVGYLAWRAAA